MMMPPVGKSGPWMCRITSSTVASGWSIMWVMASHSSRRLCGGIDVAMPTAMPDAPLASRNGSRAGSTLGSFSESSKLGAKSTVLRSMSCSISVAMAASRASVYRIAAGGSLSIDPKFPCPSTMG